MLIPLTDSTNLYTAMMLELIASQKARAQAEAHPHSHVWQAPKTNVAPRRRRLPLVDRVLRRRHAAVLAPSF
jgi:hypothetical protein